MSDFSGQPNNNNGRSGTTSPLRTRRPSTSLHNPTQGSPSVVIGAVAQNAHPTSFHVDDVVALHRHPNAPDLDAIGYVDRTHGDVETHDPYPASSYGMKISRHRQLPRAAYKQFLVDGVPPKGFVLVQWQTHPKCEVVPEKELVLLDRSFMAGDIVKRDHSDTLTGTVVSVRKRCTLLGMCETRERKSGKVMKAAWLPPPFDEEAVPPLDLVKEGTVLNDIPAAELQLVHTYKEGDLILYKNWCGRVRECFDEVTIRLPDNGVCVVKDDAELDPLHGDSNERPNVGSLVKTKKGVLRTSRWIYGAYNPNTTPIGVVVDVRTHEMQVDWLSSRAPAEPNKYPQPELMIGLDELESAEVHIYDLTRRPRSPVEGSRVLTKSANEVDVQGGLRVRFKDIYGASVKYDGSTPHGKLERVDRKDTLGYDMNVFTVMNTFTEIDVQWTDLSVTSEPATLLVPNFAVDDEDAVFPGEIVCSNETREVLGEFRPARVGVAQQVNATDRMATVRWCDNPQLSFFDSAMTLHVPMSEAGTISDRIEEVSFYDIKAPEGVNRRRGDFVLIPENALYTNPQARPSGIDWMGEVVDIGLDGDLTVRLGAAEPVTEIKVKAEHTLLALRADDLAGGDVSEVGDESMDIDDEDEDEDEDWGMDYDDSLDGDDEGTWVVAGDGMPVDEDDDSWSTDDGDEEMSNAGDDSHMHDDLSHVPNPEISVPPSATDDVATSAKDTPEASSESLSRPSKVAESEHFHFSTLPNAPPAYDILSTPVPANHPFASRANAANPTHMKVITKDHKILRAPSALPEGIYVRTWESRLDLLRVLFVGPLGTPYEYAPFVVDLYLPNTYPAEPPQAHFHSWTAEGQGMQGRVNPNLYEDGKICLSLLGTWQGDDRKGEGWRLGQSTVLQVLVSILGLVLVREPYYNEAGYEPLQGLASSKLSSAVYTERTYLRARAFLLYPLSRLRQTPAPPSTSPSTSSPASTGLEGLEDVLSWLYLETEGPNLLAKAIESGQKILGNSEDAGRERDGLTAVTRGAALLLRKVVMALEALVGAGAGAGDA